MRDNEYAKFREAKEEVAKIANQVALSVMRFPQRMLLDNQKDQVENLQLLNDRIAQFNDGVRAMAVALQSRLGESEEDESDAE